MCPPMRIPYQEVTSIPTPIAKSTPVTQASHVPITKTNTGKGYSADLSPVMKARATYLEKPDERI